MVEDIICPHCGIGCDACYKRGYEDMIIAFENVLEKAVDDSGETSKMNFAQKFAIKKMLSGMLLSLKLAIKTGIGK